MSNILELPVRPNRLHMRKRRANGPVDHNVRHAPSALLARVGHKR